MKYANSDVQSRDTSFCFYADRLICSHSFTVACRYLLLDWSRVFDYCWPCSYCFSSQSIAVSVRAHSFRFNSLLLIVFSDPYHRSVPNPKARNVIRSLVSFVVVFCQVQIHSLHFFPQLPTHSIWLHRPCWLFLTDSISDQFDLISGRKVTRYHLPGFRSILMMKSDWTFKLRRIFGSSCMIQFQQMTRYNPTQTTQTWTVSVVIDCH